MADSTANADYRQTHVGASIFDVTARGKAEATGPDARIFLHNLATNDVTGLPLGGGCEAFLTTAKARIVAHVFIHRVGTGEQESCWIDTAPGQASKVLAHLERFIVSEQLELFDRTSDYAQWHLAGPEARAVLERAVGEKVPDLTHLRNWVWDARAGVAVQVRRVDFLGVPGYDLVCPKTEAPSIGKILLAAGAAPAGQEAYEILRVEAGMPLDGVDIDESTLAMEVDRTAQAISYKKGCFLGQEPIVRARDLGHVNRALRGLKMTEDIAAPLAGRGTAPHTVGDALSNRTQLLREGKEVGQVTSAVVSPRLGPIALAYVRRGHDAPGTRLAVGTEGGEAEVVSLPFNA